MNIQELIDRNALFVVNHSGGKDSQAMHGLLHRKYKVPTSQILVLHANLPGVEWQGTEEHVHTSAAIFGDPVVVCQAKKTFFDMVDHRQMWPSPKYRQCTSDLKRGPLEKAIRHYLKANPQYNGLVVNCMGMRAEESTNRAKLKPWQFSARNSKAGREWYEWLPIKDYTLQQVWDEIEVTGQTRHWAYTKGMSRLSCVFCIMASKQDLQIAARLNPGLYRDYVMKELEINHTLVMPRKGQEPQFLEEYLQIPVTEVA